MAWFAVVFAFIFVSLLALSADVTCLFPAVTPWKLITGIGTAEVRSQAVSS